MGGPQDLAGDARGKNGGNGWKFRVKVGLCNNKDHDWDIATQRFLQCHIILFLDLSCFYYLKMQNLVPA